MDMQALRACVTGNEILNEEWKKYRVTDPDPYGNSALRIVYYKLIQGNYYYEKLLWSYQDHTTHDELSLQLKEIIDKNGFKRVVDALEKVIKLNYKGQVIKLPRKV